MMLGQTFEDDIIFPTREKSERQRNDGISEQPQFLNIFPNPSNGPVAIAIQLPEGSEGGLIRVFDPMGRTVMSEQFTGRVQLLELNTAGMMSGIYFADLAVDNISLGQVKFEILK